MFLLKHILFNNSFLSNLGIFLKCKELCLPYLKINVILDMRKLD